MLQLSQNCQTDQWVGSIPLICLILLDGQKYIRRVEQLFFLNFQIDKYLLEFGYSNYH
jgi:hypothetical protein